MPLIGLEADVRRRDFIALAGGVVTSSPAWAQQTAKQGLDPWLHVRVGDPKRLFDEIEESFTGSLGLRVRIIACKRFGRLTGEALFHPRHGGQGDLAAGNTQGVLYGITFFR